MRHLVTGPVHTHRDFAFLGHSLLVKFEHHEVIDIKRRQHWSCQSLLDNIKWLLFFTEGCSLHNTGSLMAFKSTSLLVCAFALALRSYGKPATWEARNSSDLLCICNDIAATISGASEVFFPRMSLSRLLHLILIGDEAAPEYSIDISHAASSSSQASTCSVEPGSTEDVSKIVSYLDMMHQLLPTLVSTATYPGIKPNTLCGEKWGSCHEPRIFLD